MGIEPNSIGELLALDQVNQAFHEADRERSIMQEVIILYTVPSTRHKSGNIMELRCIHSLLSADRLIRLLEQAKVDEILAEEEIIEEGEVE